MCRNRVVSVIIVSLNSEKYISQSIESVMCQSYSNIQLIIIDGGSTDKTLRTIEKYKCKIDILISEPDNGIYDAFNKGLLHAKGEYICILNSDDWYVPNAIEVLVNKVEQHNVDFSYGNIVYNHNTIQTIKKPVINSKLKKKVLQEMAIPHISLLIKRDVYNKLGSFSIKYKIAGDHEFLLRLIYSNFKGKNTDEIIGHVRHGGVSNGYSSTLESFMIAIKYGKNPYCAIINFLLNCTKKFIFNTIGPSYSYKLMRVLGSRHSN